MVGSENGGLLMSLLYCEDQQEDEGQGLDVVSAWHPVNAQWIVMTLIPISSGSQNRSIEGSGLGWTCWEKELALGSQ